MAEAYIVAAVRTAGGRRDGKLKDWHRLILPVRAFMDWWIVPAPVRKLVKMA